MCTDCNTHHSVEIVSVVTTTQTFKIEHMNHSKTCLTNMSTILKNPCSCENGELEPDLERDALPGWGLTGVRDTALRRCRCTPDRNEFWHTHTTQR